MLVSRWVGSGCGWVGVGVHDTACLYGCSQIPLFSSDLQILVEFWLNQNTYTIGQGDLLVQAQVRPASSLVLSLLFSPLCFLTVITRTVHVCPH